LRRPGVIAGIAVAIPALALWRLAPSHDLRLKQLTFDLGFAGWPALSSDGKMVAEASGRDGGGNPGSSPVRLHISDPSRPFTRRRDSRVPLHACPRRH